MAKILSANEQIIKDANKAAACGMSYGEWVKNGRPEPESESFDKLRCYRKFTTGKKKSR